MENVSILQARVPDSTHEATESHYIGPSQSNFSILDIFAVYDMWNVDILVRKIVIRGVTTKNETQNAFLIFWSSKIFN